MSKQVRTQMPQTQKKDKWSKSKGKKFDQKCMLIGVCSEFFPEILIFLLLTASDNQKTE